MKHNHSYRPSPSPCKLVARTCSQNEMPVCPTCSLEFPCPKCGVGSSSPPTILDRWEITAEELTEAIDSNPSLRGMMLGYIAEVKLHEILVANPLVTDLLKDDDHNRKKKGDRRIIYQGYEFIIESKSLQTAKCKRLDDGTFTGGAQVDGSDRRTVTFEDGTTLETTNLLAGEFDVLAVNIYAFEDKWRFVYALNRDLPRSRYKKYSPIQQKALLATMVPVTWPPTGFFTENLFELLDQLIAEGVATRARA